jgi:hypothetical protein
LLNGLIHRPEKWPVQSLPLLLQVRVKKSWVGKHVRKQ